jgi:hypothetical protein
MSLDDKLRNTDSRHVSRSEIIITIIVLCMLFSLLSFQHIFADNWFVMRYMSGKYGALWFALLCIAIYIYAIIFSRRKGGK